MNLVNTLGPHAGSRAGSALQVSCDQNHRPALPSLLHPQSTPVSAKQVGKARCPRPQITRAQRRNSASTTVREVPDKVASLPVVSSLLKGQRRLESQGIDIGKIVQDSLILGLTGGTVFQVTHNQGLLPVYHYLNFNIGPFLNSGLVPILLAPIWVLYGWLYPILDELLEEGSADDVKGLSGNLGSIFATWAILALTFIISDELYLKGIAHPQIHLALFATAVVNYFVLDRTRTGLILGPLLAVGAPAAESFIVNVLHLWHYERPDFAGVVTWAGWCYAAYGYGVGNVARFLVQQQRLIKDGKI